MRVPLHRSSCSAVATSFLHGRLPPSLFVCKRPNGACRAGRPREAYAAKVCDRIDICRCTKAPLLRSRVLSALSRYPQPKVRRKCHFGLGRHFRVMVQKYTVKSYIYLHISVCGRSTGLLIEARSTWWSLAHWNMLSQLRHSRLT